MTIINEEKLYDATITYLLQQSELEEGFSIEKCLLSHQDFEIVRDYQIEMLKKNLSDKDLESMFDKSTEAALKDSIGKKVSVLRLSYLKTFFPFINDKGIRSLGIRDEVVDFSDLEISHTEVNLSYLYEKKASNPVTPIYREAFMLALSPGTPIAFILMAEGDISQVNSTVRDKLDLPPKTPNASIDLSEIYIQALFCLDGREQLRIFLVERDLDTKLIVSHQLVSSFLGDSNADKVTAQFGLALGVRSGIKAGMTAKFLLRSQEIAQHIENRIQS
jgi:hypothetical protein